MPVQEQRTEITELGRGHPDRGESILRQQLQEERRISTIMFLPRFGPADRWRVTDVTRAAPAPLVTLEKIESC